MTKNKQFNWHQSILGKRLLMSISSSRLAVPLTIASVVGMATGLVVVGFIGFIELCETFFFVTVKDALFSLGPFSVILIPALGGLLLGPLVTFVAPEAKGHGVPEVMKAITLRGGKIRPIVVLGKALASAIALGTGASVGREGPIVQIGSALGSGVGQFFKLSELRVKNLVACGAAAGIAGVFNTPIAGVMFALEVILRDFGARALSTVVVAAVSASIVSHVFLGKSLAFDIPLYSLESPFEIFLYLILGVLSAFAALTFISVLHKSEAIFEAWKFPEWLKPAVGGLLLGCIGFFCPQIFGSGLETIQDALHGHLALNVLLLLIVLKILGTSICLGSGSSGGVFAPALFIGAVLGGAFGNLVQHIVPFEVASSGAYALVGMASVFAGAAHAPVTAILIVFEMTGDYSLILPLMVGAVLAASLSQVLRRESIYTIKLKESGIDIYSLEGAAFLGALRVGDAMSDQFVTVPRQTQAKDLLEKMSQEKEKTFFAVNSRNEITGMIRRKAMQEVLLDQNISMIIADDIAVPVYDTCFPDDPMGEATRLMKLHHTSQIPVVDPAEPKKIIGMLRSDDIFRAYTDLAVKRDELVSRMEQEDSHADGAVHIRFNVPNKSPIVGKRIKELTIPDGVVLTSVQRKTTTLIPEGDTLIEMKDRVWAVVLSKSEPEFRAWLKTNKLI